MHPTGARVHRYSRCGAGNFNVLSVSNEMQQASFSSAPIVISTLSMFDFRTQYNKIVRKVTVGFRYDKVRSLILS